MKILLTSSGFTTQTIIDRCARLVGKNPSDINMAVINEGYTVEHGDHSWVIDELSTLRRTFGGTIELVNILALDIHKARGRIDLADMIYVVGGNTDYLMHVFGKTGFSKILPELLKNKVYVGSSAGSMVIGNRVSTDSYQKIYSEGETFSIDSYLGLVDIAIKPHLNSPEWPNNRENKLLEVTQNFEGTLYGLSDSSAISVEDDAIELVGIDYLKIVDGIRV